MLEYLKLNFRELMTFRVAFVSNLIQRVFESLQYIVLWLVVIMAAGDSINGWSTGELLFIVGFFELNMATFYILSASFFRLPLMVIDGDLDSVLILPQDPTYALIGKGISPDSFIRPLVAIGIITTAALMIDASPLLLLFSVIVALAGSILENLFFMTLNLLSFWVGDMAGLMRSLTAIDMAKQFPLERVTNWLRLIFTFVMPIIFVSTIPASIVTQRIDVKAVATALFFLADLLIIWALLFRKLWKFGLGNYQSGGSL